MDRRNFMKKGAAATCLAVAAPAGLVLATVPHKVMPFIGVRDIEEEWKNWVWNGCTWNPTELCNDKIWEEAWGKIMDND